MGGGGGWGRGKKKEGMDQWLLAVTSNPAAKGLAKDLEIASAGPIHCHFYLLPSILTMCSSERCLSTMHMHVAAVAEFEMYIQRNT